MINLLPSIGHVIAVIPADENYVQIAKKNTTTDYLTLDINHIKPSSRCILKRFADAKFIRKRE